MTVFDPVGETQILIRDAMVGRAKLTVGLVLGALCLIAACVGVALLIAAHAMPAHVDERRAAQLTGLYEDNYVSETDEQREPIEREIASLRTSKWKLYHAGLVVSLGSIVLLYAWFRFKLWDLQNLKYAKTPRTRLSLLALASGAWLALLPAIQLGINDDFAQDDLTPQVDTGNGTFLIFGPPFFLLTLIVILAFGRFFVLRRPSLPANLWCWDSSQPKRSWILTAIYTLLGVTIVLLFVWSIGNLPWVLPSLMIGFYVILSSRAAVINRV